MKNIILLLVSYFLFFTFLKAQTVPNSFNYIAIVRNSENVPISNTTIGVQISILKNSVLGEVVYSENHILNTNSNGLLNINIGTGIVQNGAINSIKWSENNYFIKVEVDVNGGTNYSTIATNQLLSVPYALHVSTTDSLIGGVSFFDGNYNDLTNQPTTIDSIFPSGDTLLLTNGQIFHSNYPNYSLISPTIVTNPITGIRSNSASFSGFISAEFSSQILERGFVYSTETNPTINSKKIVVGNGNGAIDTILEFNYQYEHILLSNTIYYVRTYVLTENNTIKYGNEENFTTLPVGQVGPSGGVVFFDKGIYSEGWRYLETTLTNLSTFIGWGCPNTTISGTQFLVGSGQANTNYILAGCNDEIFAAKLCDTLVSGGQNDWFLPSVDELNLLYKNLQNNQIVNLSYWVWSSSEYVYNFPSNLAWIFALDSGTLYLSAYKSQLLQVRPVRSF